MPTTTATYEFDLPSVGGDTNGWGAFLNGNWTALDALLDGTTPIAPNLVGWAVGGTLVTATAAELNLLDGVTASTAELNILDGVTATASELNALDGITATVTELNYTDGVTSNIQTQLNAKAALASPALTGTPTAPTASLGTDTNQIATMAALQDAVALGGSAIENPTTETEFSFAIPAGVSEITLHMVDVNIASTASINARVGTSGGEVTSGYNSAIHEADTLGGTDTFSTTLSMRLLQDANSSSQVISGHLTLKRLGVSSDIWSATSVFIQGNTVYTAASSIDAGGEITTLRLYNSVGAVFESTATASIGQISATWR